MSVLDEIPQAVEITGILTAAGLDPGARHHWFHRARQELGYLTPAAVLVAFCAPSPELRVLELARRDASALATDLDEGRPDELEELSVAALAAAQRLRRGLEGSS